MLIILQSKKKRQEYEGCLARIDGLSLCSNLFPREQRKKKQKPHTTQAKFILHEKHFFKVIWTQYAADIPWFPFSDKKLKLHLRAIRGL